MTMRTCAHAFGLGLLGYLALLGCGGRAGRPTASGLQVAWAPAAAPGDPVVATVGGVGILASQLTAHMRATSLRLADALDDLVAQEVLAQEARRRGLQADPDVVLARKQEMVRRFVVHEYGDATGEPSVIPPEDAMPNYHRAIDFFEHDTQLAVWNVCTDTERARAIYEDARAHPPRTADEFQMLAQRHGAAAQPTLAEFENRALNYDWRKALFAAVHKKGDLLPPATLPKTGYACPTHIAWCEQVIPPRHDTFEQALPEIRQKIFVDWRRHHFFAWTGRLVRAHATSVHPEALEK